jgi:hypothetical protein
MRQGQKHGVRDVNTAAFRHFLSHLARPSPIVPLAHLASAAVRLSHLMII